ncbi:MAG: DUF4097 family beta strand repeat protein, partial [Clostridia bacterium]|nr:DUF4097 family beta strand repeat protein [Clostridia bacterium]
RNPQIEYYASDKIVYDIDIFDDSNFAKNWENNAGDEYSESTAANRSDHAKDDEEKTPSGDSYGIWIRQDDERKWYEKIGIHPFSWKNHKLTVYLPQKDYKEFYTETIAGNVTLNTKQNINNEVFVYSVSGDISVKNINTKDISVNSTSGEITTENINAKQEFNVTSISSDITLKNISTNEEFFISTTSGDITAENISANDFSISTVSGDINATLPEGLDYHAETTSGDINIPKSTQGGKKCTLSTVSGDINVEESK